MVNDVMMMQQGLLGVVMMIGVYICMYTCVCVYIHNNNVHVCTCVYMCVHVCTCNARVYMYV